MFAPDDGVSETDTGIIWGGNCCDILVLVLQLLKSNLLEEVVSGNTSLAKLVIAEEWSASGLNSKNSSTVDSARIVLSHYMVIEHIQVALMVPKPVVEDLQQFVVECAAPSY